MPNEPVTVFLCDTGEPAVMHSVDAAENVRLGYYRYATSDEKDPDPEAMSRARARFMGGGVEQAELKSPEQREDDTRKANELEAQRTAAPMQVVMAPQASGRTASTKADTADAEHAQARERHPAPGRSER